MLSLGSALSENTYPGRGIFIGKSADEKHAVIAYFIMGRSENSRNRVFSPVEDGIETKAFDPSKLKDPSLIIYAPVRVWNDKTIVTNGDQTDTIYDALAAGGTFESALRTRAFEPDAPNFTPRISALITSSEDSFFTQMSILKTADSTSCQRFFFEYEDIAPGTGYLIHTYDGDGDPIPSFSGTPRLYSFRGDPDDFTRELWGNLNAANKVSLFTRFIRLSNGCASTRIMNKNK